MADPLVPSVPGLLRILLEAGEENVPTLLNTFQAEQPSASPDALLAEVGRLLATAEAQGYVAFAWYRNGGWVTLVPEERNRIEPLSNAVAWDGTQRQWRWREEEFGPERPIVILTEAGDRHIRQLLRS